MKQELNSDIKSASIGQVGVKNINIDNSQSFFYDPGLSRTAACTSTITYIDGNEGILRHRGYPVEEVADHKSYTDLAYLLLNEDFPNSSEKDSIERTLVQNLSLSKDVLDLLSRLPRTAHPMSLLATVFSSLECYAGPESGDESLNYIAKVNAIGAAVYRNILGLDFVEPDASLSFMENVVNMMFHGIDGISHDVSVLSNIFDKIFILHADHEQNASTSVLRSILSTKASVNASITGAINALSGASHGGANEAVIKMLHKIQSKDNIPSFIAKAKDKNDPFRLMGFGHRVYKNYDPRSAALKKYAPQILDSVSGNPEVANLLDIARELESIALSDDYFISRKLFPNVDFYSGIIYQSFNIPSNFFTVLFAMARSSGWVAQTKEFLADPEMRISRPRQIYQGHALRHI